MSVWQGGARSVGGRNELTRGSRPEAWLGEVAKAGAPNLLAYHRGVVRSAPTFLHFFNFAGRNRRPSLPLYDDTRLQLKALTGEKDFGAAEAYIHASRIPGDLSVIITQAPIPFKHGPDQSSTVADFWRMVHQEGVHTILALGPHAEDSAEPEKASYFHPKAGKTVSFKPFSQVCTKKVTSTAAAVRRDLRHVFKLEKKLLGGAKVERSLLHLEADWWKADMEGLPRLDEAVALVEATLEANDAIGGNPRPPVLIHCWDGGRRSGLLAALLLACAQLSAGSCPDLATIARRVRLSRYGSLPAPLDLADLWRGLLHYALKKGILPPNHNSVKAFQTALAHARPILQSQTQQDEIPDIADGAAS